MPKDIRLLSSVPLLLPSADVMRACRLRCKKSINPLSRPLANHRQGSLPCFTTQPDASPADPVWVPCLTRLFWKLQLSELKLAELLFMTETASCFDIVSLTARGAETITSKLQRGTAAETPSPVDTNPAKPPPQRSSPPTADLRKSPVSLWPTENSRRDLLHPLSPASPRGCRIEKLGQALALDRGLLIRAHLFLTAFTKGR